MDQRGKSRWRAANGLAADVGKTFLGFGLMNDAIKLGVEALDHCRRRTLGGQNAVP